MALRTKVFISYSHKDRDWLERLQVHLKPLEREGIVDRWDDTRIRPGHDWREEIERALDEAAVAVLLVSADFLASDFIANEELPPLLAAAETKGTVILSVIVKPSRFSHTPSLARFQAVNKPGEPLIGLSEKDREEWLVRVTEEVEAALDRMAPSQTAPDDAPPDRVWNVPHERNSYFTGRQTYLSEVHSALTKEGKAMLSGLGGMGKTQIAVEYAYRHRSAYQDVFWIPAETSLEIAAGYGELARLFRLPQRDESDKNVIVEAVKRWLGSHDGWLLVFDNADFDTTPGSHLLKPFLPLNWKGHVLITSRFPHAQALGIVKSIAVQEFLPAESVRFLHERIGITGSDEAAEEIAAELGHLPLALEQAAAYMVQTQSSFGDYLTSYRQRRLELLERIGPVVGTKHDSVAVTWSLNFRKVEIDSPASADLLRAAAILAPDGIPLELFEKGAARLGPALSTALAGVKSDPLVLSETLEPLTRYSLLRRDPPSRTFSVHRVVQEVVRDTLDEADRRLWSERVVEALSLVLPAGDYEHWPEWDRFFAHAKVAAESVERWNLATEASALVLHKLGHNLLLRGRNEEAERLHRRALEIRERVLGKDHPDTAESLNNLALLYVEQGRYEEAEPLFRRALEVFERVLGKDNPTTATSLNNLAGLYVNQGRYEEAEPLFRRALEVFEQVLGKDHPDTATSLNNLAELYREQGRYEEAEPLHLRAIEIRERVPGKDHPDTAESLNNLALLYDNQGRYEEAEPLYRRALEILEQVLGEDHPKTVVVRQNYESFLNHHKGDR